MDLAELPPFYAIVDSAAPCSPLKLAELVLEGGARILQLRLKDVPGRDFLNTAIAIARLCHEVDAKLIVNDRPDIALLAGADGVHVGQDDLPLKASRRLLGVKSIIGVSTHNLEQAIEAEREGADYIGFGPIFPGGLKNTKRGLGLDGLREVRAKVKIPIVAIGGIKEENVQDVLRAGADSVAIISDVIFAEDIPRKVRSIIELAQAVPRRSSC